MPSIGYSWNSACLCNRSCLSWPNGWGVSVAIKPITVEVLGNSTNHTKCFLASFTNPLHMWSRWWLCGSITWEISELLFPWKKIRNEEGVHIFWRVGRGETCCIYQRFWVLAHGSVLYPYRHEGIILCKPCFYNKCSDYIASLVWPRLSTSHLNALWQYLPLLAIIFCYF